MMEIAKTLILSTAHVTEDDAKLLDQAAWESTVEDCYKTLTPIVYAKGPYGWWVNVPSDELFEEIALDLQKDFSPAFCRLLSYAAGLECDWIMLDRDGDTIDELETFDW